jgi:hypothetical protein
VVRRQIKLVYGAYTYPVGNHSKEFLTFHPTVRGRGQKKLSSLGKNKTWVYNDADRTILKLNQNAEVVNRT